jgi:hypothetical protein
MTPLLLREVGDLLTDKGQNDEAGRTYSEIVEFDPGNLASRRLLGDIYLGRGWYDAAYRQYRTLTELEPTDFSAWLRLASSAAGSGRLDEALRLERKVAEAEGIPCPNDPRRWSRLSSAAKLARMISSSGANQLGLRPISSKVFPGSKMTPVSRENVPIPAGIGSGECTTSGVMSGRLYSVAITIARL